MMKEVRVCTLGVWFAQPAAFELALVTKPQGLWLKLSTLCLELTWATCPLRMHQGDRT